MANVYNSIRTGQQIDNLQNSLNTTNTNLTNATNRITTLESRAVNRYQGVLKAADWVWYNESSGVTQDVTEYVNKWHWEKYASTAQADNILQTLASKTVTQEKWYLDTSTSITMNIADSYTAVCTTYISCNEAVDVSMRFETDDTGRVFLNDELICGVTSCTWTAYQTLHFKAGENKLVVSYTEGSGGDGWICDPKPSTLVGTKFKAMSAVPQGGYKQTVSVSKLNNSKDLAAGMVLMAPTVIGTTWNDVEGQRIISYHAVSIAGANQITVKTANNMKPITDLTVQWLGF